MVTEDEYSADPIAAEAKETRRFSDWIKEHKDVIDIAIKATGLVVAVVTLSLIYSQIKGLREQNLATWFSNRPALRILPLNPASDLNVFGEPSEHSIREDLSDTLFFKLTYTIGNVGNTPAAIDTAYYEMALPDKVLCDTVSYGRLCLAPSDEIIEAMRILLRRDKECVFKITIAYDWERPIGNRDRFRLEKYYRASFIDNKWRTVLLAAADYEDYKTEYSGKPKQEAASK
ncbi:MAG: hypothetical protein KKG33_13990 [candidate division Zixibacteria bacterium]|nr:hypothetical protein [candidate division Zixibacteria bacterium]MBU1471148.1 hypothetical protein [candidate division Zixibacteria bacterium]MBU2626664.1 hypothetical protein [candidate division Zixibacteria bacterium]